MTEDSGRIYIYGDTITYRSRTYGDWELTLSEVRVLGEATNENGPFVDDYFLCFATGPDRWYEASFYAEGRDTFLEALGGRLGVELTLTLTASTSYASNVLWPSPLTGRPMFTYTHSPPKTWFGRLFGVSKSLQDYSDEVVAALRGQKLHH